MAKRKKSKLGVGFTLKTYLSEMEAIKANYQKARRSHREQFRITMEMTQRMIVRFEKREKLRKQFRRAVLSERRENGRRASDTKFNLSLEVAAKTTGAISYKARKIASKQAQALDYLREIEVPVSKTALTIKEKGGIDKILAEATRKKRGDGGLDKRQNGQKGSGDIRSNRTSNDQEIAVPIWIKMSDRDQIAGRVIGTRFMLTALRVSQPGGDLKISAVDVADGDHNDDWSN
jgi:hypothetical protein